jgi:hypothetical protein
LVPRQHSTGGQPRLRGIRKRGDVYLRTLFVHGARTTLRWLRRKTDRRSTWLRGLMDRRGKKKAAVALANKNARIAWVLRTTDQVYSAEQAAASRGEKQAMAGLSTRCEGPISVMTGRRSRAITPPLSWRPARWYCVGDNTARNPCQYGLIRAK